MNQLLSVILTDNASSPLYEKIFEFLQSKPMLVLIATVALTALMRASIKIYNSGRLSKNDLITKSEFEDYKTKEKFTTQIYSYDQELGIKTQILRCKGIHLFAMYTDSMTLLPHYNGSTYGLIDINSGTFYGNSNTSGRFRGIFGRNVL